MDAERKAAPHAGEQVFLEFPSGGGIANDADRMARGHLRFREIAHMPENSPDR